MNIQDIEISKLTVNRANDRHGELENETAAIAWLFNQRERHMKSLAKDIAVQGKIYELPLVSPDGSGFLVFDGNRRITCLKLLKDPKRAPTVELQDFFTGLKLDWPGEFPSRVACQVEDDRNVVDEILFRRHTGSQQGVGQSTWDDRMKATFVNRTGKGSGKSVADFVEERLKEANLLSEEVKLPRSTMSRLLSAEHFRNRVGFSLKKGKFIYTHSEAKVLSALSRIANDMVERNVVLGNIWDIDGKNAYLDILEAENVLPTEKDYRNNTRDAPPEKKPEKPARPQPKPPLRSTLIPHVDYGISWPGRLQRHHQIWDELQYHLELKRHSNAISVLFRVLLELSVENYIKQSGIDAHANDKLALKCLKVGKHLRSEGAIDEKELNNLRKFQQGDQIISADTFNKYVHSSNFAPSPEHLRSMWDSLSNFIVLCLLA